jgi:RES domain-containing protein
MLTADALRRALRQVELVEASGPWVRAIDAHLLVGPPPGSPPGASPDPLWAGGARKHGARFTPKGGFETLYLASDLVTVGREIGTIFPSGAVSPTKSPFTVAHVTGHLVGVLDLTNASVLPALRTSVDEMTGPWRLARSPPTHRLAQQRSAAAASRRSAASLLSTARARSRRCS